MMCELRTARERERFTKDNTPSGRVCYLPYHNKMPERTPERGSSLFNYSWVNINITSHFSRVVKTAAFLRRPPQREHRFTASSNFGSSHNKKHGLHHDGHCDRIMPNNKKSHKARKPTRRPRNPKRKALESLTSAEASGAPAGTPQTSCPPAAALASHRA